MENIAIIGAGASGLFLAKLLSDRADCAVYLFEKGKNVGTKLRASGGGKANIFNENITPSCYNQQDFMTQVLKSVQSEDVRAAFEQMGLSMVADEEGRVYPMTMFSQTVVDVLYSERYTLELEYEVHRVCQKQGRWHINDYPVAFDKVVFATGSPANMIPKNREHYNAFLTDFNLKMQALQPSLVGFKMENYPKKLSGCRTKVIASLYQDNTLIHKEAGEVIFKDEGISGIVILNLSAYYNRLPSKKNCSVVLNFMYQNELYDVKAHLQKFGSMRGILHPKLNALYEQHPFDVKHFPLKIKDTYDIDTAQVCHGGIDVCEVDEHFALKRFPGLFVTGELLDVDGICGGYNLFFAFASAMMVARGI